MAEKLPPKGDGVTRKPERQPWSPPRLLEYGHIGKLTQGPSGASPEFESAMIPSSSMMCL